MQYLIRRLPGSRCALAFNDDAWRNAGELCIDHFHPASSSHRPETQAKLLYDDDSLHAVFHVRDRYVKCLAAHYQDMVCNDSCVELFLQPHGDGGREGGYFNFELNCGGTMLLYYIEDATRVDGAFAKYTRVSSEHAAMIEIATTMPGVVPVEITEPIEWSIAMKIPFAMLEQYVGVLGDFRGQTWRGNLYKCGDKTSHPHWASWAPIGEELNFHQPDKFGELLFK